MEHQKVKQLMPPNRRNEDWYLEIMNSIHEERVMLGQVGDIIAEYCAELVKDQEDSERGDECGHTRKTLDSFVDRWMERSGSLKVLRSRFPSAILIEKWETQKRLEFRELASEELEKIWRVHRTYRHHVKKAIFLLINATVLYLSRKRPSQQKEQYLTKLKFRSVVAELYLSTCEALGPFSYGSDLTRSLDKVTGLDDNDPAYISLDHLYTVIVDQYAEAAGTKNKMLDAVEHDKDQAVGSLPDDHSSSCPGSIVGDDDGLVESCGGLPSHDDDDQITGATDTHSQNNTCRGDEGDTGDHENPPTTSHENPPTTSRWVSKRQRTRPNRLIDEQPKFTNIQSRADPSLEFKTDSEDDEDHEEQKGSPERGTEPEPLFGSGIAMPGRIDHPSRERFVVDMKAMMEEVKLGDLLASLYGHLQETNPPLSALELEEINSDPDNIKDMSRSEKLCKVVDCSNNLAAYHARRSKDYQNTATAYLLVSASGGDITTPGCFVVDEEERTG